MDIWVVSSFDLLQIALLWTFLNTSFRERVFIFLGYISRSGIAGSQHRYMLSFYKKLTTSIKLLKNPCWTVFPKYSQFSTPPTMHESSSCSSHLLMLDVSNLFNHSGGVNCYRHPWLSKNVDRLFMCLLAIQISSFFIEGFLSKNTIQLKFKLNHF